MAKLSLQTIIPVLWDGCAMRFLFFLLIFLPTVNATIIVPPEFDTPHERLLFASVHDNVELAREALDAGAGIDGAINCIGHNNLSNLHVCAMLGNRGVASLLLERGASVSREKEWHYVNALGIAAQYGQTDIMRLVMPYVDRLERDAASLYEYAFVEALQAGQLDAVKLLVQSGMDPKRGIYRHADNPDRPAGAGYGVYTLSVAATHGDPAVVKYLLDECGVDPNPDYGGRVAYPLWTAVGRGNLEATRLLVEKGADVNATASGEPGQLSCLALAVRNCHTDCVDLLIENGAKPVAQDPEMNPMIQADWAGFDHYVKRFEEMSAKLDLWKIWEQKQGLPQHAPQTTEDTASQGSVAAHLIEEDWEVTKVDHGRKGDKPSRIAILGDSSASAFSDLLLVWMSDLVGVQLVERNELDKVIEEHKLSRANLVKIQGLQEFSRLVAADHMILVSTIKIGKAEIYRVQFLDVKRGLMLDVRYAPKEDAKWEAFCTGYANFMKTSLLAQVSRDRIPVSLIGVNANWGNAEGKRLEKDLFLALQHSLSRQPGILLLERESLRKLATEKRIGGTEVTSFENSGFLITARVDIDIASGELQKIVLKADKWGDPDAMTFEETAGGKGLVELSGRVVGRFAAAFPQMNDPGKDAGEASGSVEADRKAMIDQASWLQSVGMGAEAHRTMENAIALGADDAGVWGLYLETLDSVILQLHPLSRADDANNRRIMELEHDRLDAFEKYLVASQHGEKGDFERRNDYLVKHILEGFSDSLFRMRAVCMKRRYQDELQELEKHFKDLFDRTIKPLCEGRFLESRDGQMLLMATFRVLPYLSQQSVVEYERLVGDTLAGMTRSSEIREAYPRSLEGGLETWYKWIRKYASPPVVADFFRMRGEYLLYAESTTSRAYHSPSAYNRSMYQLELGDYLDGIDSPGAEFARIRQQIEESPQCRSFRMARNDLQAMPLAGQRLHASLYSLEWAEGCEAYRQFGGESSLAIFSSVPLLDEMLESAKAVLGRMRDMPGSDPRTISGLEFYVNAIRSRISKLAEVPESHDQAAPSVDAYLWDMRSVAPGKNNRLHLWAADDPDEYVFHADGAQWILGQFHRGDSEIWLIRMDGDTREVSSQVFVEPEGAKIDSGSRSFIIFTERKIVIGSGDGDEGTLVLDRGTSRVSWLKDYIPCNRGNGPGYQGAYHHKGSLYYMAIPRYMRKAKLWDQMASLVFLKLDLETMKESVLFNFRRNPPVTPLDKPIMEGGSAGQFFSFAYNAEKGLFAFKHNRERYLFEPATGKFAELTHPTYGTLVAGALQRRPAWLRSDDSKGLGWSKLRSGVSQAKTGGRDVPLELYNYGSKESKTIGLRLKALGQTNTEKLDRVGTAIRNNDYFMNESAGRYSAIYVQEPFSCVVLLENESLSEVLGKATPIRK